MTELSSGNYLCRTQAGFKKACKLEYDKRSWDTDMVREGFPKKYPCVVWFSEFYRGYEGVAVHSMSLNRYAKNVFKELQELLDLDPVLCETIKLPK